MKKIGIIFTLSLIFNYLGVSCLSMSAVHADTISRTGTTIKESPDAIRNEAEAMGIDLSGDIITISDSQMIELINTSESKLSTNNRGMKANVRANGTTRIVRYGGFGNFDIRISASFIKNYYWALGAGATVIAALAPGIGWGLAFTVLSLASSLVGNNSRNGVIIRVRGFAIQSSGRQ